MKECRHLALSPISVKTESPFKAGVWYSCVSRKFFLEQVRWKMEACPRAICPKALPSNLDWLTGCLKKVCCLDSPRLGTSKSLSVMRAVLTDLSHFTNRSFYSFIATALGLTTGCAVEGEPGYDPLKAVIESLALLPAGKTMMNQW